MKQRKLNKRKGFTLVELLVVIAILAVLATVSVVGYTSFTKKAKVSNDVSLTTQMNTILQANEVTDGKNATPHEAVEELVAGGLDVTKLTPTANGYSYVYDLDTNRMVLVDEKMNVVSPDKSTFANKLNVFAFVEKEADLENEKYAGYSFYLKNNFESDDDVTVKTGVDTGNNNISKLTYTNTTSTAQNVVVRTNGGTLVVDAETDEVEHYGYVQEANIIRVKMGTYKEYGKVLGNINLGKGKVEVSNNASVSNIIVKSMTSLEGNVITPSSNNEVAIVVNGKASVATISSEVENISTSTITSGTGANNVAKIEKDDENVAYIGANGYLTLADAVKSIKSTETITLTKDISSTDTLKFSTSNASYYIDLNGHNIDSKDVEPVFNVNNHSQLTITNNQVNGGKISSNKTIAYVGNLPKENSSEAASLGILTINKNVELNVDDVTRYQPTVFIVYGSTLNVYGKLYNKKATAIQGNGTDTTAQRATKINLYPGSVAKSESLAIYHPQLGTLNIDGATVEGYCAVGIKSGTLNIVNGSTVRGIANDSEINDNYSQTNGISYDGSAILVDTYVGYAGNMNINIENSTVESLYSYALKEIKAVSATSSNVVSLNVSGNSVIKSANPDTTTGDIYVKEASSVKISGGTFSKEVYEAYIESGYKAVKSNNVWIVKSN